MTENNHFAVDEGLHEVGPQAFSCFAANAVEMHTDVVAAAGIVVHDLYYSVVEMAALCFLSRHSADYGIKHRYNIF